MHSGQRGLGPQEKVLGWEEEPTICVPSLVHQKATVEESIVPAMVPVPEELPTPPFILVHQGVKRVLLVQHRDIGLHFTQSSHARPLSHSRL